MDPKKDKPVTSRSSRPTTPATPARSSVRQASASRVPHKQAWVVADWKHRVPDPGLPGPKPTAGSLNSRQRAQAIEQRRKQLTAEYAHLYDTINHILDRCGKVQQRLGSSSNSTPGSSKPHSPTYISKRSRILFEAPGATESAAADSSVSNPADAAVLATESDPGAVPRQTGGHQQQGARPATWAGAVDLNPGFSFRPGSPECFAATCRDDPAMLPSKGKNLADYLHCSSSSSSRSCANGSGSNKSSSDGSKGINNLKHREVLQAGIQQLNGEFYAGMRAAALKSDNRGVVPAS